MTLEPVRGIRVTVRLGLRVEASDIVLVGFAAYVVMVAWLSG